MEDCVIVPLTRGQRAVVDAEDYPLIAGHSWFATPKVGPTTGKVLGHYAAAKIGGKTVYLHRLIMGVESGVSIDHADGNGLNNRRINLRRCTQSENMANAKRQSRASGYRGVYKHGDRFRAICGRNEDGRNNYVGSFETPEDAAKAYDAAALKRWGQFASLNFEAA